MEGKNTSVNDMVKGGVAKERGEESVCTGLGATFGRLCESEARTINDHSFSFHYDEGGAR